MQNQKEGKYNNSEFLPSNWISWRLYVVLLFCVLRTGWSKSENFSIAFGHFVSVVFLLCNGWVARDMRDRHMKFSSGKITKSFWESRL